MKRKIIQCLGLMCLLVINSGCGKETVTPKPEKEKGTIQVLEGFYSEELGTENTVRIYLPPEYENSEERYPVIYMFDGQNLFDCSTATYQKEWHIDESLDTLYDEKRTKGIIVVGVVPEMF